LSFRKRNWSMLKQSPTTLPAYIRCTLLVALANGDRVSVLCRGWLRILSGMVELCTKLRGNAGIHCMRRVIRRAKDKTLILVLSYNILVIFSPLCYFDFDFAFPRTPFYSSLTTESQARLSSILLPKAESSCLAPALEIFTMLLSSLLRHVPIQIDII
jgi:hypothetical protein